MSSRPIEHSSSASLSVQRSGRVAHRVSSSSARSIAVSRLQQGGEERRKFGAARVCTEASRCVASAVTGAARAKRSSAEAERAIIGLFCIALDSDATRLRSQQARLCCEGSSGRRAERDALAAAAAHRRRRAHAPVGAGERAPARARRFVGVCARDDGAAHAPTAENACDGGATADAARARGLPRARSRPRDSQSRARNAQSRARGGPGGERRVGAAASVAAAVGRRRQRGDARARHAAEARAVEAEARAAAAREANAAREHELQYHVTAAAAATAELEQQRARRAELEAEVAELRWRRAAAPPPPPEPPLSPPFSPPGAAAAAEAAAAALRLELAAAKRALHGALDTLQAERAEPTRRERSCVTSAPTARRARARGSAPTASSRRARRSPRGARRSSPRSWPTPRARGIARRWPKCARPAQCTQRRRRGRCNPF